MDEAKLNERKDSLKVQVDNLPEDKLVDALVVATMLEEDEVKTLFPSESDQRKALVEALILRNGNLSDLSGVTTDKEDSKDVSLTDEQMINLASSKKKKRRKSTPSVTAPSSDSSPVSREEVQQALRDLSDFDEDDDDLDNL